MKHYLRLYRNFITLNIQRSSIYRADFYAWMLVSVGWFCFNIIFFELLFSQVDTIGGWSKGQVFILQGIYFVFEFIIWGVLFPNLETLPRDINQGKIDLFLTKPVNSQFLLTLQKISINNTVNIPLSITVMVHGYSILGIFPQLVDILFAAIMLMLASVFFYAGYVISVTLAFWFERLDPIIYIFPQIREFSRIPRSAYPTIAQKILSFVIPALLITTVPAQIITGHYVPQLIATLAIFAMATLALSHIIFQYSLHQYSSASS